MLIGLKCKEKTIKIQAKNCSFFQKFTGLMFCRRENAEALLFGFKKPVQINIHSWFVFFPFVAVWLDNKKNILCIKKIRPFEFAVQPEKKFTYVVEIPINKRYQQIIDFFVGN